MEDDFDLVRAVTKSSQECAECSDRILLTDEVFMITMVRPYITDEGLTLLPDEAEDGDFSYEPRFLELECWEKIEEELREQLEDTPPIEDPQAILECDVCASGIRMGEMAGLASFGEIHASKRCPDGIPQETFVQYDPEPIILCTACMQYLNKNILELWDGTVQESNECEEGTAYRCWRYGCPNGSCDRVENND